MAFDLQFTLALQQINFPGFALLMQAVSWLGDEPQMGILITVAVLSLLVLKLRWETFCLAIDGIGIYLLGNLIKAVIQRPRPTTNDVVNVFTHLNDWGFPSGHVLSYTACFGFLAYLASTLLPNSLRRTTVLVLLIGLIILVGLSRVYLGAHWASDVLGTYLLGSIWLLLVIRIYNHYS